MWDSYKKKHVRNNSKSRTGLTVWTVVAVSGAKKYVKAFALEGHASSNQFLRILPLLPDANSYHADEAFWYRNAEAFELQAALAAGNSYRQALSLTRPWFPGKSSKTNIVEGIHNAFRNGISTLKRRSSGVSQSIPILQSKLNYISKRLSDVF